MDQTWIATIFLSLLLLWLLYRYLMLPYDYWKKRGVPSVPAVILLGSLHKAFTELTHEVEHRNYMKYGRLYGYYEMSKPLLMVGDLKLIRELMVKNPYTFSSTRDFSTTDPVTGNMLPFISGEKWKRLRTIVSPVFSSGKIKKMYSIILDSSKTLTDNFRDAARTGESIDLKKYFGAFTMDVIAKSAFGTTIDSHNDPHNAFVQCAAKIFGKQFNFRFGFVAIFPRLSKLLGFSLFDPTSRDFFKHATLQIIEERKRSGKRNNDFLQLLMEAKYDVEQTVQTNDDDENDDIGEAPKAKDRSDETPVVKDRTFHNQRLSHDELVSQCVLFFLAGYETTSSTLSFVAYNLALNPEWQEKVIQEVDECFRTNQDGLTYNAVMQMKCLDMVVCETLRIFPPAIRAERYSTAAYVLGDTNLKIPKDMVTAIPIYSIHHDPEYYPDPEKFDPNRFSTEEKAKRDPFTFIPFGGGPRSCIASRFALVEIKACIAFSLSRVRFERCPQTSVPIEFARGQGFLQPKEVVIKVRERNDAVIVDSHDS